MNYPDDLELEVTKLGYIGNGQYAVGNESTVYFANTDGEIVSGPYQDAGAYNEPVSYTHLLCRTAKDSRSS